MVGYGHIYIPIKEKINSKKQSEKYNILKAYDLIKKENLFDEDFYKSQVKSFKADYLIHYLYSGFKEGFNPSRDFDGNVYLRKYSDVRDAGLNPLVHFVLYGRSEGRSDKCDFNVKAYGQVLDSGLFDCDFYLSEYGLEDRSERLALLHYLEFGFKEGFNPSRYFDGDEYLERYEDVKKAGLNPLVHYVLYGIKEDRIGLKEYRFKNFNDIFDVKNVIFHLKNKVTIVITSTGFERTKLCIENLFRTSNNFKIIILNDVKYSGDFDNFKRYDEIQSIISYNGICAYIDALNNVIYECKSDIVLIKDNIITFDKWLMKFIIAAYSNERIGFVSPISNYSQVNSLNNLQVDENDLDMILSNISNKNYQEAPIVNDSCVYIKYDVFENILFNRDSKSSWLSDFYEDAHSIGWISVFDDSIYVKYNYENNLTKSKDNFQYLSSYQLDNKPSIEFVNSKAFYKTYFNIQKFIDKNVNSFNKKRILFNLHYGGGVEFTVKDIARNIDDEYECFILKSFKNKLILYTITDDVLVPIDTFKLKYEWNPHLISSDEFIQIYFYVLVNYNIDIVEIDHLIFHSFDLPVVAKSLDIPIVLALHDFYYICPVFVLLDGDNNYCGGYCNETHKNCSNSIGWFDLPLKIKSWRKEWKKHIENLFNNCSTLVTATNFTKDMFLEQYPMLNDNDIQIIEHGRDLIKYDNLNTLPNTQKIKILIPGLINNQKGESFIKALHKEDVDNKLEFHYLGHVNEELEEFGVVHGVYNREDFSKNVYKIRPSFIGLFSITAETYSHTLTESLSAGIPVIVSNRGALKSRVEENGGGWIINIDNPKESYDKILEIAGDIDDYIKVKNEIENMKFVTSKDMAKKYLKLYKKLKLS